MAFQSVPTNPCLDPWSNKPEFKVLLFFPIDKTGGNTEQVHKMTQKDIFYLNGKYFHTGLFWMKIAVILWTHLSLPKGRTRMIIVPPWLITQTWAKWVGLYHKKIWHREEEPRDYHVTFHKIEFEGHGIARETEKNKWPCDGNTPFSRACWIIVQ